MKIKLHWQILIGMFLGVIYGIYLKDYIKYIDWIGTIFIRALQMIVVPLVLTSLITGVSNIESSSKLGRLGLKTMLYYFSTSLLALMTGLFMVNLFHPGIKDSIAIPGADSIEFTEKTFKDTLIEIVPTNFFDVFHTNNQLLSVIFIALIFGIFITKLNEKPKLTLLNFFNSFFELIMKVTLFIMKFAPIGIFSLIATSISQQENIGLVAETLGKFFITCLGALGFHFFITLPLLIFLFLRINPFKHFRAMTIPLLTAFSTASSNATLPLTMEEIESKSKVSNKVSSFTLPLGATINMDGTALYELVVVVFISQIMGQDLSFTQQFILVSTALLASIGTAGIPMASLTTMAIILTALNLPLAAIAIILPVDRPLDMCRTATNVWSDSCGAVIIAKSEGEKVYQ